MSLMTRYPRPSYMPKYIPDKSCVLYLEGQQDAQSGTIRDLSGYGNHGTITGATWVKLKSGLWVNSFDGTDDKVTLAEVSNTTLDITTTISYLTWFKTSTAGESQLWARGHNNRLVIRGDQPGDYLSSGLYINGVLVGLSSLTAVCDNVWRLCSLVYDGANLNLYNATLDNSCAATGAISYPDSAADRTLKLGVYQDGTQLWYPGFISLFRIFNTALSASQIAGIYQNERYLFGV
jgi:hypothetical protein